MAGTKPYMGEYSRSPQASAFLSCFISPLPHPPPIPSPDPKPCPVCAVLCHTFGPYLNCLPCQEDHLLLCFLENSYSARKVGSSLGKNKQVNNKPFFFFLKVQQCCQNTILVLVILDLYSQVHSALAMWFQVGFSLGLFMEMSFFLVHILFLC